MTEIIDQVERDEADIASPSNFACYHSRGTVAVCAPGSYYMPPYWWSKYPEERSPVWNLVKIFTPMSWMFTFLSIIFVSIFFLLSAKVGVSYFGLQTFNEEIILSPFRFNTTLTFDKGGVQKYLHFSVKV